MNIRTKYNICNSNNTKCKNYTSKKKNHPEIAFKSGLTDTVKLGIKYCEPEQISKELLKMKIKTDFSSNKIVAYCISQSLKTISRINIKYKTNFKLPKEIYVKDFNELNIDNPNIPAFCNWLPAKVVKNSNQVFPERTLFFNSRFNWQSLNEITEAQHNSDFWSSDHFLAVFFHELGHEVHNENLLRKKSFRKLQEYFECLKNPSSIVAYREKYKQELQKISGEAKLSPFEAEAEDFCKRAISFMGGKKDNFLFNSYKKFTPIESLLSIFNKKIKENIKQQELLRKIWNGKRV